MRISIAAWSECCDSFITAWIMPLIAWVISAIFYNSLCWSRSCYNIWNVRWRGGVKDSMNVGGYQWGKLIVTVLLEMERIDLGVATLSEGGASSGQWIPRKDECPRGHWFLERSIFGNSWRCSSGRSSTWCTLLSVFESFWWDGTHVLIIVQARNWPLKMPLCFLFLQAPGREWSGLIWLWFKKLRRCLYSKGTGQNTF